MGRNALERANLGAQFIELKKGMVENCLELKKGMMENCLELIIWEGMWRKHGNRCFFNFY